VTVGDFVNVVIDITSYPEYEYMGIRGNNERSQWR